MKRASMISILIAAFLTSGFTEKGIWIIDGDSQLTIHGSTNLADFTCKIDCYNGTDTLQFIKNDIACELQFSRNRMTIPIRSFDCGARQISKDFWKTLKSETYPQLDIDFRSLQDLNLKNNSFVNGVVDITLAGVTARYIIRYQVSQNGKVILLKGLHPVSFSDFKLEAPEKLQGLIKVKEVLNVEFNLVLIEG